MMLVTRLLVKGKPIVNRFIDTYLSAVAFNVGWKFASTYCNIFSILLEASGEYLPGRKMSSN